MATNANLSILYFYNINHLKCMYVWLSCVSIHTPMCENDKLNYEDTTVKESED